ncbi:pyridine nucleotide-disulfide oxidoreductase [Polaribacter reichenbachii]|uniref:Pyridine nucleotide-disulfide oxidoreductase n=1 Tax=Polaribacter reichenbachii TaxID=996801 RepID=A0A1B8TV22_9FLAO|nr:FAD-dependent oxidoreductase [Polaribacter reichenbachii]APZ45579.1 pyridine nucleotide-disulfide oxidoreductase [Polaribacter reichenbachii]AUC19441.1 pyridine nucleotide-disulfide oxidoreductase [Polaribacter reichenbachii]OBY63404.1 pyridine nucleotide-disulfide oxidoreductase [Polaribacter reichenbachii]
MLETANQICVVIGASHAGVNFAFNLRKEGWQGAIILYDVDPNTPYHRPPLSKSYIVNGDLNSNLLKPLESYQKENITLELGKKVTSINRALKTISIENETDQKYDKLVIATGAIALIPQINGIKEATNLFAMRTAADAIAIKNAIDTSSEKRVVIIGGGYIGLETAASLKKIGAKVIVLERESRVLERVTAPLMSEYFMDLHQENGVKILIKKNVISIKNEGSFNTVFCDDNTYFEADIVIVGVGIRVNAELAKNADLEIENGIKVNQFAQTNDKNIYAIGDCTLHYNPHYDKFIRLESVQNAVDQSKVAAASICGKNLIYDTIPWFWSDQYDVKLQMVGLSNGYNEVLLRKEATENTSFSVWYFKNEELLAVDAINNGKAYVLGTRFIKGKQKINKSKLVDVSIPMKPTSFL